MKRHELRFLLGVHDDIDKACQILDIPRAEFMPNMIRFIDTVSLGIELGREMRGKPAKVAAAVIGKPSPKGKRGGKGKRKGSKASGKAGKTSTFALTIAKHMGRRTLSMADLETSLKKAKLAPKSKNLRAYLSAVLTSAKDSRGKRVFTSPARGMYFVTAKLSAREAVRKAKAVKKTAKSKANGKSAKKAAPAATATNQALN